MQYGNDGGFMERKRHPCFGNVRFHVPGAAGKGAADLQVLRANDEESLGLEISRRWQTDQKVLSTFDPNGEVKSLCGRLFENYVENLIRNADSAVRIIQKTRRKRRVWIPRGFCPLIKRRFTRC